jgi:hypothetical protein
MIEIILLIGIVKKNAIMMIDLALVAEREQGLSAAESIHQGAVLRFRPIMMTTWRRCWARCRSRSARAPSCARRWDCDRLVFSQVLTLYGTPDLRLCSSALPRGSAACVPARREQHRRAGRYPSHENRWRFIASRELNCHRALAWA